MPCDGKNKACEQRRELLHQLKCLISTMERKKPCEWDEKPCPSSEPPKCQTVTCYPPCQPLVCKPVCKPSCPPPMCPPPCEPVIRLTMDPLCMPTCKPICQPPGILCLQACKPICPAPCPLMCVQTCPKPCPPPCPIPCKPSCPKPCPPPCPPPCPAPCKPSCPPAACPKPCPVCPPCPMICQLSCKPACPAPAPPPPCPSCPPPCKAPSKSKSSTPKSCYSMCTPSPICVALKPCKSFELRSSFLHKCQCIRRDGLQDKCLMSDCMGYPECITKLFPICNPGQCALMKLCYMGGS